MSRIIGLTGGIGSGKTTIAKYFESRGVPIYIADDRAREITNQPKILDLICREFGTSIFDDKKLDRKKLASIVFNNPEKLVKLNAIIHPAVKLDFDLWLKNHSKFEYVLKESAILFESKSHLDCYNTIAIIAPLQLRIERILLRDKTSEKDILKILDYQLSDNELIDKCDYVIENSELNISLMIVDEILKKLKIK